MRRKKADVPYADRRVRLDRQTSCLYVLLILCIGMAVIPQCLKVLFG